MFYLPVYSFITLRKISKTTFIIYIFHYRITLETLKPYLLFFRDFRLNSPLNSNHRNYQSRFSGHILYHEWHKLILYLF